MIVDVATYTGIGICAGVGWLDIAAKLAWDYHSADYRTVALVERDAYAAAVLLARMEDKSLEQAAISDSIEDIDETFTGVDCIVAGFPCQDISTAGNGVGIHGKRSGLFFAILETAVRVGARYLFLENVAAITTRGLDAVLAALAESGFDAEWTCLQAAEVGASHRRERWFCVANATQQGQRELRQSSWGNGQPDGGESVVGDAERRRHEGGRFNGEGAKGTRPGCCTIFAPGPTDTRWPDILRDSPHLAPAIEPGLCVQLDGCPLVVDASRADQLQCTGNGVVVLQAAVAFAELLGRFRG